MKIQSAPADGAKGKGREEKDKQAKQPKGGTTEGRKAGALPIHTEERARGIQEEARR